LSVKALKMIVLDTNALRSFAHDGPQIAVLRKLSASRSQRLLIPEIVYEEYVAQRQREIDTAVKRLLSAYDDLKRLTPWPGSRPPHMVDSREIAETYHGGGLTASFSVIEASPAAAVEAMSRETWRKAPAKTASEGSGSGARDALVWLTLLEHARQEDPPVYFISADKAAFGGSAGLHAVLTEEATRAGVEVILLTKVEELFSALATRIPDPPDFDLTDADLKVRIREHLYHSLAIIDVASQFGLLRAEQGVMTWNWRDRPDICMDRILSLQSYRVEGTDFTVAKTRWEVTGVLEYGFEYDVEPGTGHMATPYRIDIEAAIELTLLTERESQETEWRTEILGQGRAELLNTKRHSSL
jgi:hypothetical protein